MPKAAENAPVTDSLPISTLPDDTGAPRPAAGGMPAVDAGAAPTAPLLSIEPHGWQMSAPAPLSLLEAAQQAGVRLARSCRNGTCRRCLCRLQSGRVSWRVEWPGLSAEEKAEGWILPCVAVAEGNVVIDAPGATRAMPAADLD